MHCGKASHAPRVARNINGHLTSRINATIALVQWLDCLKVWEIERATLQVGSRPSPSSWRKNPPPPGVVGFVGEAISALQSHKENAPTGAEALPSLWLIANLPGLSGDCANAAFGGSAGSVMVATDWGKRPNGEPACTSTPGVGP